MVFIDFLQITESLGQYKYFLCNLILALHTVSQ
uniref:Uncharacterized protein n=1 Tax=Arundo donax TaxID=35708 RepID=A0A0A9AB30_ARUDO